MTPGSRHQALPGIGSPLWRDCVGCVSFVWLDRYCIFMLVGGGGSLERQG